MNRDSYGCIMASADMDLSIFQNIISKNDVYDEEKYSGFPKLPHVTLLYGLLCNYSFTEIKKALLPLNPFPVRIKSVEIFTNDKYDVIVFAVNDANLNLLNDVCKSKFEYYNSYSNYVPHITVAYVKPGLGYYYKHLIEKLINDENRQIMLNELFYSDLEDAEYFQKF